MNMTEDDPVTLKEACHVVFRDTITPWTLRAEAARGRLTISRIGKRDFTTLREARELLERCRVEHEAPASTSTRNESNGSSEMASDSSARAALRQTLERLKKPSKATSGKSTGHSPAQRH